MEDHILRTIKDNEARSMRNENMLSNVNGKLDIIIGINIPVAIAILTAVLTMVF